MLSIVLVSFKQMNTKIPFKESVTFKIHEQNFMFCKKNGKILQIMIIPTLWNEDKIDNM